LNQTPFLHLGDLILRGKSHDINIITNIMKKYIRYLAQFRSLEDIAFGRNISNLVFEIICELNLLLPSFSSNPKISIRSYFVSRGLKFSNYPTQFFRKVYKINLINSNDFLAYAMKNVSGLHSLQILTLDYRHPGI